MAVDLALALEAVEQTVEHAVFSMDEEGFRRFYGQTARPLRAYLSRVLGDAELADDLLQESYFRFLRAELPTMDDLGRKNYLFRIATNLMRDHFRRDQRAASTLPELSVGEAAGEKIHLRTDVARALQMLTPRQRQMLWLAYVEGSTHAEIAEALGVKAASIKMLLFRARQRLAGLLRTMGFGPSDAVKVRP